MKLLWQLLKTIFIVCLVLAGCVTCIRFCLGVLFQPEPATLTSVSQFNETVTTTVLNIPLSISGDSLQQAAEQYVPKTYSAVDEDPTDLLIEDHIQYDLERGPINMAIVENGVKFSFPVSGIVRTRGKVNLAVTTVDTRAHANVAGMISGQISFIIHQDWQVEPDLNFSVDINEALLPVKNFGEISLRTFLETKLTKKIDKARRKLVYKILDKDRVRDEVSKAWGKMHRVEQVYDFPPVWARVVPQQVGLMPLTNKSKDALEIGLQIVLKTDIFISGMKPSAPVTPLPDAKILENVSDAFHIQVPFQIETASINNYLAKRVVNMSREVAKDIQVTIERAEIVSSSEDRLTAIIFAGAHHARLGLYTQARIYATSHVVHDIHARQIRFTDFTYDAALSRWWAGMLHWMAAPYIRFKIENLLVLPLDREIKKAHETINDLIANLVVPPGIQADLLVKPPELNRLGVNIQGIYGELQLNGNLSASLDFPEMKDKEKEVDE